MLERRILDGRTSTLAARTGKAEGTIVGVADRAHSESDRAHSESDRAHRESGQLERAVFRVQRTVVLAALLAMVCAVPFAFGAPGLAVIYLLPIGYIVWVLRTRTVADVEGLTVRTVFTQRFLPWAALKGLAITRRSKVRAVLADGGEVTLPSVRARHLPALALVSRGRITDPTEPANDD